MAGSRRLRELVDSAQNRLRLPATPFTVALSGGADSAALAYLAVQHDPAVDALHIDHGLPASTMLLINLIRGTAATGLGGIPYHRPPHIYRPTLDITRDETREMATLVGLPFRDDPMNSDPSLMRNRIRHEIIPRAREMNPQVIEALARAGAAVTADSILLDEMVAHIDTRSGVAVGVLTTLPRPLADRVLGRLLSSAGVGLTEDRLARARSVVEGRAERQDLAEGLSVVRRNAMVVIE
jgi:tRNA(Ile)-lysidine synthase TilS/MesJ